MKALLVVAVAAGVGGLWAGVQGLQLGTMTSTAFSGIALLTSANLLYCSWGWWRAKPGSSDEVVMPALLLLSGGTLLGAVPRLLWPSSDVASVIGTLAGAAILIGTAIPFRRRLREYANSRDQHHER